MRPGPGLFFPSAQKISQKNKKSLKITDQYLANLLQKDSSCQIYRLDMFENQILCNKSDFSYLNSMIQVPVIKQFDYYGKGN
jgi:hypothetical protein